MLDNALVRDSANLPFTVEKCAMATANRHWRKEFVRYVCCTLPAAFYPIAMLSAVRFVSKGELPTRSELVADGGILGIAIVLAVDALFRLLATDRRWYEFKMVLVSVSAWTVGLGSLFYACRRMSGTANSVVFVDLCFLVIAISVILAGFCQFLPEEDS